MEIAVTENTIVLASTSESAEFLFQVIETLAHRGLVSTARENRGRRRLLHIPLGIMPADRIPAKLREKESADSHAENIAYLLRELSASFEAYHKISTTQR